MTTIDVIRIEDRNSDLCSIVKSVSGIDVNVCFQCAKCASGCPLSYAMDYTPTQLIHAIQLGLTDLVVNSKTYWLCASCQACTTRCPQEVDIAEVMDIIKIIAIQRHTKAQEPDIPRFSKHFLRNIRWFGRTYELGLVASLKLATLNFSRDLGLGITMLKKGKFSIVPRFKGSRSVRRISKRVKVQERV
jgi:heterodisulfide reductase subunit C